MNFSTTSLPEFVHLTAALICALWLGLQLRAVDWKAATTSTVLHRWLGSTVVVALLWSMKGRLAPGFDLHLLGGSALTLIFGFPLASLALVLGAAAATFNDLGDWQALPINLLIGGMVPALSTHLLLRHGEPRLPANFFVYLFLIACFGSAGGVVLAGACATALLAAFGTYDVGMLLADYFPYYFLLAFSEAWLTGAVITLMVVWLPGWVASFDEKRYLQRR